MYIQIIDWVLRIAGGLALIAAAVAYVAKFGLKLWGDIKLEERKGGLAQELEKKKAELVPKQSG